MREGVQKMSCRKKYIGEKYSFFREKRNIGSGGNGAVYKVHIENNDQINFDVVAKFFEYEGKNKKKGILDLKMK